MSSNVFDQINPTIEVDTTKITDTAETTAETTTAAIDTEAIQREVTTPTARETALHISNVIRKGDCIDLVLCKSVLSNKKMTVYYADTGKREVLTHTDGVELLDTLPNGGQVINITRGTETRTYTTVNLSLDDLHLDLTGAVWEARHKIRKPKQPAED